MVDGKVQLLHAVGLTLGNGDQRVGMQGKPGVAAKVFRCLWDAGVQIINISTSEIKISMLIRTADAERATDALYENFDIVL